MTLVLPSGEMMEKIKTLLNMDEKREKEDIAMLKSWLELQPHLPKPDTIDDVDKLLFGFLYGCKNSMEKCKKVIDMYYTIRNVAPEFFDNRDTNSAEIKACLDNTYILPLPKLTPTGHRVTCHGFLDPKNVKYNAAGTMTMAFMVGDIRIREDVCAGDVMVFDLAGSELSHLGQLTLSLVRKFMICAQGAYPSRLAELHFLNCPSYLDNLLSLFKPLMKEKLADRIHVHSTNESLQKFIPTDVLPKNYGGNEGTIMELNVPWRAKIESYRDWFVSQHSVKSDESKRPGKPATQDDIFGIEGTFRQLNVD